MHCSIETGGFEHELHAILGDGATVSDRRRWQARSARSLLAEVDAVRAAAQGGLRELLDATRPRSNRVSAAERQAEELDRIVSLGLQTGRIRALYGPSGEQAALRRVPQAARAAASSQPSAKAVNEALASLDGPVARPDLDLRRSAPAPSPISLVAGGAELSVRLDRQGARLASVGV